MNRPDRRLPQDEVVGAARVVFAVGLLALQMWLLQMGVEDLLAGRSSALSLMAALSFLTFLLTTWLCLNTEP